MDQYEVAIDKLRSEVARLKGELGLANARITSLQQDLKAKDEELNRPRTNPDGVWVCDGFVDR